MPGDKDPKAPHIPWKGGENKLKDIVDLNADTRHERLSGIYQATRLAFLVSFAPEIIAATRARAEKILQTRGDGGLIAAMKMQNFIIDNTPPDKMVSQIEAFPLPPKGSTAYTASDRELAVALAFLDLTNDEPT